MAARIIGAAGKALGIGGSKKKADAATGTQPKGPVVTQLGPNVSTELKRRLARGQQGAGSRPASGALSSMNTTTKLGA